MPTVVVQKWEESERGWGTRPEGYSIHRTEKDKAAFVFGYMEKQRELLGEAVPDEYMRPCGTPYFAEVDQETYDKITGNGLRFYNNDYPGDGGPDGWRPKRT